jgi:hypothetical protein
LKILPMTTVRNLPHRDSPGEVATVTQPKTQRGPLLSSVVMVMLATAATGLLAIIGFQALPDSVVPSTFGGDNHETRNVDVSDSPSAKPSAKPASTPSPTAIPSSNVPVPDRTTHAPDPVRTTTAARPTTTKTTTATTPPPPKKTTTPKPTPTPTATQTTQAPSPAPTCGTGRKPRCPRQPSPASTPSSTSSATTSSYEAPSYSSTKAGKPAKAAPQHGRRAHR